MAVARMAAAPVVLVGDINFGGVFSSVVGTLELLTQEERSFVKAILINKFRGDISLLNEGVDFLQTRTGKKVLGVLPFVDDLQVAEEDSVPEWKLTSPRHNGPEKLKIYVIHYPHISNSTDFEPLPDALILPGSKSTIADLAYLRSSGLHRYIEHCHQARVSITGICGGYQMLGTELLDSGGVESSASRAEGLGLLQMTTCFESEKKTVQVRALNIETGHELTGYEIHMGQTNGPSAARPVFRILEEMGEPAERLDGARSEDGLIWGTYLHGVFDTPVFRRDFLNQLRKCRGWLPLGLAKSQSSAEASELLAALIRKHVDLAALDRILKGQL